MTNRILIVNADDFGLGREVNEAVVDAHLHGVVTATSVLSNLDDFPHGVDLLRHAPKLDVGVHLNLTHGRPLSPPADVPSIVCDGEFAPLSVLLRRLLRGRIDVGEVEHEWARQIERVFEAGKEVSHLDGHFHLHALPTLFPVAVSLAHRFRIPWLRLPVERPDWPTFSAARAFSRLSKLLVTTGLSLLQTRRMARSGLRRADTFWGGNLTSVLTEERLVKVLNRIAPGVTEVMCHPGRGVGSSRAMWHRTRHADQELAALKGRRVRDAIAERFVLTSFRELAWDGTRQLPSRPGPDPRADSSRRRIAS